MISRSEKAPVDPNARFQYENFSPKVQEALNSLITELIETHPINKASTATFFRVPEELIQDKHIVYFEQYARVAIRYLVVGGFYGPNTDTASLDEELQVKKIQAKDGMLFTNAMIFHDIAHTIVALGRSEDKTSPFSLIPDFQRKTQRGADYSSRQELTQVVDMHHVDELLAGFWSRFGGERGTVLNSIRSAKDSSRREDGSIDMEKAERIYVSRSLDLPYLGKGTKVDSFSIQLARRIFREYEENEMLTFDLFQEITTPLMKRHAPTAVRAFQKD